MVHLQAWLKAKSTRLVNAQDVRCNSPILNFLIPSPTLEMWYINFQDGHKLSPPPEVLALAYFSHHEGKFIRAL